MIVTYRFADGETSQVEVSDEIGTMIIESRREEENAERDARRHCWSIDALPYEGLDYGVTDELFAAETDAEQKARMTEIIGLYRSLTDKQRGRLKLYAEGKTIREIAALEGVDIRAVHDSIRLAIKKFKKFL